MEPPPQLPQQQQQPIDPMLTNVGYIPQRGIDMDPIMSKHLDASEMLSKLKYMLMGYEFNEEKEEYEKVMVVIGHDKDGKEIKGEGEPVMPDRTVRTLISSLEMYLNPNTFLSELKEDKINDIMWGVCQNLAILFFRLGNRIGPEERAWFGSTIKDAIFLGLNRAQNKITLDAISKMQQTHEIIQANPKTPAPEKEFKVLGW